MRYFSGFIFVILFAVILPSIFLTTQAREASPEEINAKECAKYINPLFDELAPSASVMRKESILNCEKEMSYNYKNGLPNYATHSPGEMEKYKREKWDKSISESRLQNEGTLKEIAGVCAKSVMAMYTTLYSNKVEGKSKEAQEAMLAIEKPESILGSILIKLSYEALNDIYSKSGPVSINDAAKRIPLFHRKCKEVYEQTLFLR